MNLPRSLWPRGFTGRVTLVLIAAMAVQFFVVSLLVGTDETNLRREDLGRRVAEQILVAERILLATPPAERATTAQALSTRHLNFALAPDMPNSPKPPANGPLPEIRASILAWEPALAARELRLALVASRQIGVRRHLAGAMRIGPDGWLLFETRDPVSDWNAVLTTLLRVGLAALIVLATAALIVRTLNRPLSKLSESVRLIGTDTRITFDETGPQELRRVSHAMNEMQGRIDDLIAQRTRSLAAVGHDLRTPLARLGMRIGAIEDPSERSAAKREVTAMSRMLQELLDYFDNGEPARFERVDVATLCQTVADDFSDEGAAVHYDGPARCVAKISFAAVERAIVNLVDNAVKYAGSATIKLSSEAGHLRLAVEDDGPGILEADRERLRLPFERLDQARGGGHSGMGLGLSIVERTAQLHGGTLSLEGRAPRGLAAILDLPGAVTVDD